PLSFYVHDLSQLVNDLDQITLRRHHRTDVLIGCGGFIQHTFIEPGVNAFHRFRGLLHAYRLASLGARHNPACTVRAGTKTLWIALASDNEATGAHGTGDDPPVSLPGTNRPFPCHPNIRAVVVLSRDVV